MSERATLPHPRYRHKRQALPSHRGNTCRAIQALDSLQHAAMEAQTLRTCQDRPRHPIVSRLQVWQRLHLLVYHMLQGKWDHRVQA